MTCGYQRQPKQQSTTMNEQVHTPKSGARLLERLSIEMYNLKGAIMEMKGVVIQCNATLDRALMSEIDQPTRDR
jgi:hypothetical protein